MVEKLQALGHEPEITLQFGTPVRYDSRFLSFYPVTAEFSFTLDYLEHFSNECHKAKTKVITLANHNTPKQRNGSIRTQGKCMLPAPSAEKRVRASHDWFGFCFSLVEKMARVLFINHRA